MAAVDRAGRLVRAFAGDRTVRLVVVEAAQAAERTRVSHGLGPDAALLAAEGVVATALMSAHIKGEERITLQIQASEPRFAFMGEIDAEGFVRARLTPSDAHPHGVIDGMLLAIKADAKQELYRGLTEVKRARLDQTLAEHLRTSQQVDAVLRIHAELGEDGRIKFAGGFLVERLPVDARYPSVTPEEFEERYRELRTADVPDVFTEIAFGGLQGGKVELLEERLVQWRCRCSQEKVEAMLGSLGLQELEEMKAEGGAEVTCHFCNTAWKVTAQRLGELARIYTVH
jgi:molecular chaperone Hsp33